MVIKIRFTFGLVESTVEELMGDLIYEKEKKKSEKLCKTTMGFTCYEK